MWFYRKFYKPLIYINNILIRLPSILFIINLSLKTKTYLKYYYRFILYKIS